MNMALAIEALHPGAEQPADYVVENDSDGRGQRLAYWNADVLGPAPTEEHLEQGWRMHLAAARRAEILAELADLDRYLPRSVEDLIESGALQAGNLGVHNQERLARKHGLRAELAGLAA